jgi:hypothetical protein
MNTYKIVNLYEGFQNSYGDSAFQVWVTTEDNQKSFCGIFKTESKAQEYVKERESQDGI